MCTAISFCPNDHYFGRNLDLERSYNESVIITPRRYPFHFRNTRVLESHLAIIGVGIIANDYPLYFDAANEAGLSMAGLNFPGNAHYFPRASTAENITPFELIPRILGCCKSVAEAIGVIKVINLWDEPFSENLPLSPLHWLLSDKIESATIECTADGLKIYHNPVGVLTNNPPFPYHLHNLTNYMALSEATPENRQPIELTPYSLGLGSFGLPGDMSSGSRFVKAAFTKLHSRCENDEASAVSQFFHILGSVCQQNGLTKPDSGEYEYTQYTTCCNTDKCIYYYTTYNNSTIHSVHMHTEDLDTAGLIHYPMVKQPTIVKQN